MNEFIDATVIKGNSRSFSVTVNQRNETDTDFEPMDLDPYKIRFVVLGAPTADAKELVVHEITQVSDIETDGQITVPQNGEFYFTLTKEDTITLGLGHHPIKIDFLDINTDEYIFTLTEGGLNGEFSKIHIVEV